MVSNRYFIQRFFILSTIIFSLSLSPLKAQAPDLQFEQIPANFSTQHILEDRDGFLWLGTITGLVKYDGYRFERYGAEYDNAPLAFVNALFEDSEGLIWMSTPNGPTVYNKTTDTFTLYRHDPDDPTSISSDQISGYQGDVFIEPQPGVIWIATNNGLNRFDKVKQTFTTLTTADGLLDNDIQTLFIDHQDDIWIGLTTGVQKWNIETETVLETVTSMDGLTGKNFELIYEDYQGDIWIGGTEKLHRLNPQTKQFIPYGENSNGFDKIGVEHIFEDEQGYLWIITVGGDGLTLLSPNRTQFYHYNHDPEKPNPLGLSGNRLTDIYQDSVGNIWLTGFMNTLHRYAPNSFFFKTYIHNPNDPNSLSDTPFIPHHYQDSDEEIWISLGPSGLARYDPKIDGFTHYRYDPENSEILAEPFVESIIEDSKGRYWISSVNTISQWDKAAGRIIKTYPAERVLTSPIIDTTNPNIIWYGSFAGGLIKFNPDSGETTNFRPDPENPTETLTHITTPVIIQDNDGFIWIASVGGGIIVFDPRTEKIVRKYLHDSTNPNGLSSNIINFILIDSQGNHWVSTDSGLNLLNPETGTTKVFSSHYDNFPLNEVAQIIEDEVGGLWVTGLDSTLVHFDPETQTTRQFTAQDGLPPRMGGGPNKGLVTVSGEIWLGMVGLVRFHPDDIQKNSYKPPVYLTKLTQGGEPIALGQAVEHVDTLELDRQTNFFEFEAAALNYTKSTNNQYRYKLEGIDTTWYEAGTQRHGRYAGLPDGTYTLKVMGANNDGVWSDQVAKLTVIINPPWWRTWWAYTLCGIGSIIVVVGYVRYRTQAQQRELAYQRQERERERQVIEKLQRLDKLKDAFLANTSHELRTPLNGIIGLAESLIDGVTGDLPSPTQQNLRMIVTSGKRLANLVNDILDFAKLKNQDLRLNQQPFDIRVVTNVVLPLLTPLIGSKPLTLTNHLTDDLPLVYADENRLQQILYNLIGNAIKFTEQGQVDIYAITDLSKLPSSTNRPDLSKVSQLVIAIQDTGIGIASAQSEEIFQSFEQGDGSTAREYGGTGLGLAITKQLVELHQGYIWVESELDQGSTFYFTLPLASKTFPSTSTTNISTITLPVIKQSTPQTMPKTPPIIQPTGKFTILIVDDEPVNLKVLSNYLTLEQYNVIQASSGFEALALVDKGERFDLVILDVMMPRMSGYETSLKLREKHAPEQIPIIMLTAKNQIADLVTGFEMGANDYLTKPVNKDELLIRLKTLLHLKQAQENIRQSEEKYRRLFEDSKDIIFIAHLNGQIIDVNPVCELMLGYTQNELRTMSMTQLYVEFDTVKLQTILQTEELIKDYELVLQRKNGQQFEALLTATVNQINGQPTVQGIIRDISVRKKSERERLKLIAIQQELSIAQDIQESLLPEPTPNWSEIEVICFSTPATEVGGDFYKYYKFETIEEKESAASAQSANIFSTESKHTKTPTSYLNRYAFAVGDISGKGVSAALLMATSLSQFDASLSLDLSPAERMLHLDNVISPYTKPRRQNCAMCYVELTIPDYQITNKQLITSNNHSVFDSNPLSTGYAQLTAVNAGCIPPYIKRSSGEVEMLDVSGFALGQALGGMLGYEENKQVLHPNDFIILISDGVVEANNLAGEMLGFDELFKLLSAGPADSATNLLHYLQNNLFDFIGEAEQHDDMTIVIVRV